MPQTNDLNFGTILLIGIVVAIFLVLIIVKLTMYFLEFARELRYLNCEIGRTTGERLEHFKKQKRRLWLSLIPFVKY